MAGSRDGRSETALPRMDWYPQDYLADRRTRVMTLEAHGAYRLLLDMEWLDGPLPTDHGALARLLGTTPAVFRRVWKLVGPCFEETAEGLVNPRLERERAYQLDWRERKRRGGKASAASMTSEERSERARKAAAARHGTTNTVSRSKQGSKRDSADDVPTPANPSPSPSPSPIDPPNPPAGGRLEEFFQGKGARPARASEYAADCRASGQPDGVALRWLESNALKFRQPKMAARAFVSACSDLSPENPRYPCRGCGAADGATYDGGECLACLTPVGQASA